MGGTTPREARYRFGSFALDPEEGTLSRNGVRIKLQDLPFRLLVMLVQRPGEIVTREEVRQRLWPENTFVEFDNSLGVAIRKVRESLNDNAEAPVYVATIPRRGYRFIAPVVVESQVEPLIQAPEPAAEPMAILPAPPDLAGGGTHDKVNSSFQPHWSYWLGAGLVLIAGVAAVSLRFHTRAPYVSPKSDSSVTAGIRLRRSVAVLGFKNLPGRAEDDWLSPVFSEMLDTELGTRGDLRMVSGEDVARVKHELPPAEGASLSKATLDHLRTNPGADVVVLGSYTPLPGKDEKRIRLDLRVQDTADGETIAEEAITGDRDNLFDLAAHAGARVRQRLGLGPNSSGDASAARLALPADQASARLYVEGREKLWAFDFMGARDLLLKAVAADPQFPLAHSALSEAWWHLGYGNQARAEAQRARELSGDLAAEDRLLIEGQYWRAIHNWPQAVQAYGELFRKFPDSLDYGLLLATAQMNVQPSAALKTLAALRRLPSPAGEDARIDMTEASAWIGQDMGKAQAAAHAAIEKGRAQERPVLVARTYAFLCQQGEGVGAAMGEVLSDCESARQYAVAAGDRNGEAIMLTDLAGIHTAQGEWTIAEELLQNAVKEFREVGNPQGVTVAMANLAAARLGEGDLTQARKLLEDSIPNYQAIDDKEGLALTWNNLGDLSRQNGKLNEAETDYRQARTIAEEVESKIAEAYAMDGLGDLYTDRGELTQARKWYEGSLNLRKQMGAKQTVGECEISLARLAIENGQAADAEEALRRWKEQFRLEQQADDELSAGTWLAEALIAQGKRAEAENEITGAKQLAARSQNLWNRLEYELAGARVSLASDHPEIAKHSLEQVLREARAHGLVGVELETRLVLGNLEKRAGRNEAARDQLVALERMAREKGYGLVARKAAAARV